MRVKGYERKIPVFYGIDYLTHDIPTYVFSVAENYSTCYKYFSSLRLLKYPLQAVVSDDNTVIFEACHAVYPKAITQLCTNHYKETIRANLGVRVDDTYREFMGEVESLFKHRISLSEFQVRGQKIYRRYGSDPVAVSVLTDIARRMPELTAYTNIPRVPQTTNLIESYNSHLEGRLKTIKGFESFTYANNWLNTYFLRRRTKKLTDCGRPFKNLNGRCSLEESMTDPSRLSEIISFLR